MTHQDPELSVSAVDARRSRATILQAKAAAHPLRLRILRLCGQQPMTNKQLADRLDSQPGTTLYHVRLLVEAGLLEPAPIRTGTSGALEKPYRSTGQSWWLSGYGDTDAGEHYDDRDDESSLATIEAFQADSRRSDQARFGPLRASCCTCRRRRCASLTGASWRFSTSTS